MIWNASIKCSMSSKARALSRRRFGVATQGKWSGRLQRRPRRKLDVLGVLGGDGTIRTAAEICGAERSYLIPLPGGTMNMLAKALYGDLSWEDALDKTLASPSPKALSGGRVADKQFFIAA